MFADQHTHTQVKFHGVIRGVTRFAAGFVLRRHSAGAVLRTDGSAFSFGDPETFGDSSEVSEVDLQNIKSILCPRVACAGIKTDGSVAS